MLTEVEGDRGRLEASSLSGVCLIIFINLWIGKTKTKCLVKISTFWYDEAEETRDEF